MSQLIEALGSVAERLATLAQQDADLRTRLRTLAQTVLLWTEEPVVQQTPSVLVPPPVESSATEPVVEIAAPVVQELPALVLGSAVSIPLVPPVPVGLPEVPDTDLPIIEARCRMKAEGARWAAKRRQLLEAGVDFKLEIEPLDREVIEKAKKLPDCFLWTNHPTGPSPSDVGLLIQLGGCFDTQAEAIVLVRGLLNEPKDNGDLEEALHLLAESQSALRIAVQRVGYTQQDRDQLRTFQWIRGTAWRLQFYIDRYLRMEDPADPGQWADLSDRIEAVDSRLTEARQVVKQHQAMLKKVRYHTNRIQGDPKGDHSHDWNVTLDTVEKLVRGGIPPSNTDIRELLLPVIDHLPEVPPKPGVQQVLREIDRFLASRPTPYIPPSPEDTAHLKTAADLLRGRSVVLIGGLRRPQSEEALVNAFGLSSLNWIETREHESIAPFETQIARPDVAVVLLAIRWSSHSFGDVREFCERHGKPLVRLPAGYGPNQVAAQILQQASERLMANDHGQ